MAGTQALVEVAREAVVRAWRRESGEVWLEFKPRLGAGDVMAPVSEAVLAANATFDEPGEVTTMLSGRARGWPQWARRHTWCCSAGRASSSRC